MNAVDESRAPDGAVVGGIKILLGTWLRDHWLGLRDDASPESAAYVRGTIDAAAAMCLLSEIESELWLRRIQTCPGHDDEGGRRWCAFCGAMPAANGEGERG